MSSGDRDQGRDTDRDSPDNASQEGILQDPEAVLRREVPIVFNRDIDGQFDPMRAQLLLQGHFVPPATAAVLEDRLDKGLRCHVQGFTASYASSKSPQKSRSIRDSGHDTRERSTRRPRTYGGLWTRDEIELLVRSHAKRVDFHTIATLMPPKTWKACETRFYKLLRSEGWKPQWRAWRSEHDARHPRTRKGGRATRRKSSTQPRAGANATAKKEDSKDIEDQENNTGAQ